MDDLFDIAIKMEKNGEAIYLDALSRIENKEVGDLLQWMAQEEANHRAWFTDRKNKLNIEIDEKNLKEMVPGVLEQMMGENALSLDDIDFSQMTNVADLLDTFAGFEQETILFYQMLEMFIEDEKVLKGLESIIAEEKRHAKKLQEMQRSIRDV